VAIMSSSSFIVFYWFFVVIFPWVGIINCCAEFSWITVKRPHAIKYPRHES